MIIVFGVILYGIVGVILAIYIIGILFTIVNAAMFVLP